MNKVDTNLYSRQIKTLGIETMRKLQNLNINYRYERIRS